MPTHNRIDLWRNLCTTPLYFVLCVRCHRKEVHVRYLISWWVSCSLRHKHTDNRNISAWLSTDDMKQLQWKRSVVRTAVLLVHGRVTEERDGVQEPSPTIVRDTLLHVNALSVHSYRPGNTTHSAML